MDVQYYTDPWPHVVIDNFLPDDIFDSLIEAKESITKISNEYFNSDRQTRYYVLDHLKDSLIGGQDLKNADEKRTVKYEFQKAGIYDILIEYNLFLKEQDHIFRDIYERLTLKDQYVRTKSGLQIQSPGFEYEIHPEAAGKLMSLIAFISPEDNNGTWLYKSRKQDYDSPTKKIEWKQNRAFIFCGIPDTTWHSFNAKQDIPEKRITLGTFFYGTENI